MAPEPEIRPYRPSDRAAVVEICHRTGYMGEDVAPHFRDRELFALIFALAYVEHEPEHCLVADDGGQVVGYCIGTPDTEAHRRRYADVQVPAILRRLLSRTLWRHPRDAATVWRWKRLSDAASEEHGADLAALFARFPAHLHIDLLPSQQRRGLGTRLLNAFLDHVEDLGAPGLHLVTTSQNTKAVPFYEKMGFELRVRHPDRFWRAGGGIESLVFTMELPRHGTSAS